MRPELSNRFADRIIDGKSHAAMLRRQVASQVAATVEEHGFRPGLAVVLAGKDPASEVYVRNKQRHAVEAGMESTLYRFDASAAQDDVLARIRALNKDPKVHGILVQLPLPGQIDEQTILSVVDPAKDVDGFHPLNVGWLAIGSSACVPCTPLGCLMLLKHYLGELSGLHAVVVGRSNIVGKPMASLLLREHCTVTITHSRTRDLPQICRGADILVAAVGQPQMIKGDWIKPGASVIDVGINRIDAGEGKTRLVGDVDFDSAIEIAGAITPVPGGVGPMTIACLLHNTLTAACRQHAIEVPTAQ